MAQHRPFVISLAGMDPSAGAGLLADIKTFEALGTYGLGVCTALTVQTDTRFISAEWQSAAQIIAQLKPLLETFPVQYCKIGIMKDADTMLEVISTITSLRPGIRIVLDPVLKASAGYTFHDDTRLSTWKAVLEQVYLLTPNYQEAMLLTGAVDGEAAAKKLASYCAILLKGGHRSDKQGIDTLYLPEGESGKKHLTILDIPAGKQSVFPKHGSGCVLSAAITAQLAAGMPLQTACITAKLYTEKFLASHSSLLGYHNT
ncbi:hydroxymethylpyrimidine/phosphomethylpyrimidine kinase [Chitinophaga rhizophila]|uniref:hydroxymethylpyrimidine kinase n=1 Tax=Chitinophaga rhizophila TaxID=2866212 RepID=A0ABS7GE83_9BACT|nr:hydroxymethylpyrimidine/phosphomethylpyrimidine kinase [Chitinophaga rhizophila]MBW8685973.1 hydroxymethylpyrimidine/phosphomethylpyrimidine kinase [Chitinophaga rhizophila]